MLKLCPLHYLFSGGASTEQPAGANLLVVQQPVPAPGPLRPHPECRGPDRPRPAAARRRSPCAWTGAQRSAGHRISTAKHGGGVGDADSEGEAHFAARSTC